MVKQAKPICDECKEYADIHRIKNKKTGEELYQCYECGSIWNGDGSFRPEYIEDYVHNNNIKEKVKDAFEELD